MKYTKKSYTTNVTKKVIAKKAVAKAVQAEEVKFIKAVTKRDSETKTIEYQSVAAVVQYNNSGFASNGIIPLSPSPGFLQIVQNPGQGDRIGNKIKTAKMIFSFVMYPLQYNATTNIIPSPTEIKVFIVSSKIGSTVPPTSLGGFFQFGDSSANPTSTLQDMISPVNKDLFTVYAMKTFKLGCSYYSGSNGQAVANFYSNNDFKFNQKCVWDVTKHIPATIGYSDANATVTSRCVYAVILACNADGTSLISSQIQNQMVYNLRFDYTDN